MTLVAPEDLAMILPIPVAKGTPENGVGFIDLEGYPNLFEDLDRAFPKKQYFSDRAPSSRSVTLKVVEVGSFVASFVPTQRDFERLDLRFRLPIGVWKKLGQYEAFGFAVFQLKEGTRKIHPMAFAFPTAHPDSLFFPTVHIHDGEVHAQAHFDHVLYAQTAQDGLKSVLDWQESPGPAASAVNVKKSHDLVAGDRHVLRRILRGNLPNEDTWLRVT